MEKKLYVFLVLIAVFVVTFVWHIQGLNCGDDNGFDLDCHKMYMSFGVLFCVGILLLTSAGFYVFSHPPTNGGDHAPKNVFDTFAKQLIPIATLVLGYYFGTSSTASVSAKSDRATSAATTASNPASGASAPKK